MNNPQSTSSTNIAIPILLITMVYGIVFHQFYFTHKYLPVHDFNVSFVSGHLMTNYLFNGFLPLWSPEQNCGSPVWPDVEVFPGFDPISLIINFIYAFNGGNSIHSHVLTMFFWHVSFAIGGMLFFRKACNISSNASIFGFTLLLFSSLTVLNFRQSDDYITVYKYVPLLAYTAYRYFKNPSYTNSALLGLMFGLNICGYQTPHVTVLVVFALLAAIPMFRTAKHISVYLKPLILTAIITLLIAMPFLVAGMFWISNEAVARSAGYPLGYRGGLDDLLGPLVKYYPDETIIYIGILPFLMVVAWLTRTAASCLLNRISSIPLWPDRFMLFFAAMTWIMYIGFPENFVGADKPFFQIRSYNDMLPFILFCCVYFGARMFETIEEKIAVNVSSYQGRWRFRDNPMLLMTLAVLCITVFTELSRPSILSFSFNRYTPNNGPDGAGIITNYIPHFSLLHWGFFALFVIFFLGLGYATSHGKRRLFFISIMLIAITDLSLMNIKLLTTLQTYATPNKHTDIMPSLSAPMPISPPYERNLYPKFDNFIHWFKQANEIYHNYSATTDDNINIVWFRTRGYQKFIKSVNSPEPFEKLTGVTSPLLYYTNRLIKVDTDEVFPTINKIFTDEPSNSAIVVDNNELPPDCPEVTGAPVKAGPPTIIDYSPNSIKLRTQTNEPAYLVYLDSYTPAWRALIDGKQTDIIKANYLFKSVYVPAGSHIVEFIYRPLPYIIAFWARIFGYVLGVAFILISWIKPFTSNKLDDKTTA